MEESMRVKEQDSERLANRIRDVFLDVYPALKGEHKAKEMGKVISVVTFVIRENGTERLNSEIIEMSRYYMCLIRELEYADVYMRLARLGNADPSKPFDLRGLKDILGDTI